MTILVDKLEKELARNCHLNNWDLGFQAAIDVVKQHSDWISVDERLPELGERVLTFTASGIETLYRSQYDSDLFIWERDCCQDYWTDEEVTHWQPLPQPPSEV